MKRQKNDIHVLDWGKIAESNSTNCVQTDKDLDSSQTGNKGILFEDVIEKLLLSMFPEETWKRTGESHDGKRDFVYPAEEYLTEQKWAECKNYNSNLSINVIAPTLIMGAINDIKSIFFFSYSPLNDTAIENLLRFSEVEKLNVRIYDGNFLENLICIYHTQNGLGEFFPNTDFEEAHTKLEKKQFRIIKTLYDLNGNKIPSTHRFELGELFYIRVIIQNLTTKSLDYEMSFRVGNPKILHCQTFKNDGQLPAEEIKKSSILCETLTPGGTSCTVEVSINGKLQKIAEKITVVDEPYLAWSGESALKAQKDGYQHLVKKDFRPLFVVGESGTGKSTLTEILLHQKQIQELYKILKIDLSLTRNNCMRNLFSQMFGMYGKETSPKEQTEGDENALSLLVNSYAESADMIAQTMMMFYTPDRPYLIVVDDVQKISRPYISLFQKLDVLAHRKNCVIYYLFTLNEKEMSSEELCSQLNWDIVGQKRECKIIKTTKFRKKDILLYMKTRYGLEVIDQYFDNFEKGISPLELHSFCTGLIKERVIAQLPGKKTYQIIDHFKFSDGIKQLLFAETIPKKIDDLLTKGGQEEFLLKYLYIADTFSQELESKYVSILQDLIDNGILQDKDGTVSFYHIKIKTEIGKKLKFTEEDYADIFADENANNVAKAICALEQIGRLRAGTAFLKNFFSSSSGIEKGEQRYQICKRVFQHLGDLNQVGLCPAALQFVKQQFDILKDEQSHKTFFRFLNDIADSALKNAWDIDEKSTEIMAFFIKKYFDRALSTYNQQKCLYYFRKYEERFNSLEHMPIKRRNFWLSHYANRAAIALDRESIPLTAEPTDVTDLYKLSELYSEQADDRNQLILQITVDNFNRHYVYRHDLTIDNIYLFYGELSNLKEKGITDSMVLDYHLLLLEYLQNQTKPSDMQNFAKRVHNTLQRSTSAFYTMKLYILEVTVLISLHCWDEAAECLSRANEFAYQKEMRAYVYKLTYIETHLTLLANGKINSSKVYQQAVLAMEQMINTHRNMVQGLKREIFLLIQLMKIITTQEPDKVSDLISHYSKDNRELMHAIYDYIQGKSDEVDNLFHMQSFFVVEGISFPSI